MKLDVRATIFRPHQGNGQWDRLRSTKYRIPPLTDTNAFVTTYHISEKWNPGLRRCPSYILSDSEALARSFLAQKPEHHCGFTKPAKGNDTYHQEVQSRIGVPLSTSKQWSRKARSFFWSPIFAFGAEEEPPIAVLCLDALEPLDSLNPDQADELTSYLLVSCNLRLGPLLKIAFNN